MLGGLGAAIGVFAALGIVIARRQYQQTVDTVEDALETTSLPALGGIPNVRPGLWRRTNVPDYVLEQPGSDLAETIRAIFAKLQLGGVGPVPRVLAVTSPSPGDGKSSLVVAAARIAAADGLKVMVIEGDLRQPSLARLLGVRDFLPLHIFLNSDGTLEDLLVPDPRGTADFALARPVRRVTRALLEGQPMIRLLSEARSRYDLVLIDTPPVMRVVDTVFLARQADGTVICVAAGKADRRTVRAAVTRLEDTGCPVLGVVVTRVRNRRDRPYVYQGYGRN
jgi:capsular exopolysaccharide synthesis family protein